VNNQDLRDLNFRQLLHYGGQPSVEWYRSTPWPCNGYCVACDEQLGLRTMTTTKRVFISHGADTSDYEQVLGPLKCRTYPVIDPILFLLADPGADYGHYREVAYSGSFKWPTVNCYYWVPPKDMRAWPENTRMLSHYYGDYFAYLMRKHDLHNVYITNVIKCGWGTNGLDPTGRRRIVKTCYDHFLKREFSIFSPRLVVCFGRVADTWLKWCLRSNETQPLQIVCLYHPAAIRNRSQTWGKTPERMCEENNERLSPVIAQLRSRSLS
jgi:hypothetical protein